MHVAQLVGHVFINVRARLRAVAGAETQTAAHLLERFACELFVVAQMLEVGDGEFLAHFFGPAVTAR